MMTSSSLFMSNIKRVLVSHFMKRQRCLYASSSMKLRQQQQQQQRRLSDLYHRNIYYNFKDSSSSSSTFMSAFYVGGGAIVAGLLLEENRKHGTTKEPICNDTDDKSYFTQSTTTSSSTTKTSIQSYYDSRENIGAKIYEFLPSSSSSSNSSLTLCDAAAAMMSLSSNNNNENRSTGRFPSSLRRHQTIQKLQYTAVKDTLENNYSVNWDTPLGEGSFGQVYLAIDKRTGEELAVKKISKQYTDNISFQREMDALLQLRHHNGHPHICGLRENYEEGSYYYLVLDLVSGGEMFDQLCTNGAYSEADAARLIREVANALSFLHGIGIVHGDMKVREKQ
jgi:Protein kinase domain